jgi:hypothetical protein
MLMYVITAMQVALSLVGVTFYCAEGAEFWDDFDDDITLFDLIFVIIFIGFFLGYFITYYIIKLILKAYDSSRNIVIYTKKRKKEV